MQLDHLLREVVAVDSRVVVIKLRRNFGQTPALAAGFDHAGAIREFLQMVGTELKAHVRLIQENGVPDRVAERPGEAGAEVVEVGLREGVTDPDAWAAATLRAHQ